jgi:hypothetical protein
MYKLKEELKEKLDQLSEANIIYIMNAYQNLPRQFPTDLLDDINEMVYVTI